MRRGGTLKMSAVSQGWESSFSLPFSRNAEGSDSKQQLSAEMKRKTAHHPGTIELGGAELIRKDNLRTEITETARLSNDLKRRQGKEMKLHHLNQPQGYEISPIPSPNAAAPASLSPETRAHGKAMDDQGGDEIAWQLGHCRLPRISLGGQGWFQLIRLQDGNTFSNQKLTKAGGDECDCPTPVTLRSYLCAGHPCPGAALCSLQFRTGESDSLGTIIRTSTFDTAGCPFSLATTED
ncbi:hypothetical protein Bbelb_137710 [Branchiostoma belcheri]|nr:hypothetical protein Bbelb_137710 [Branchiostoma belcheri]